VRIRVITLLIVMALAVIAALFARSSRANPSPLIPYCGEVKNENYSGPCIVFISNGVITAD
jgi:hypothetical protein